MHACASHLTFLRVSSPFLAMIHDTQRFGYNRRSLQNFFFRLNKSPAAQATRLQHCGALHLDVGCDVQFQLNSLAGRLQTVISAPSLFGRANRLCRCLPATPSETASQLCKPILHNGPGTTMMAKTEHKLSSKELSLNCWHLCMNLSQLDSAKPSSRSKHSPQQEHAA